MEYVYTSRYGKIIKFTSGLTEYWYKDKLIARGSSIASPDYRETPTKADWAYCVSLHKQTQEEAEKCDITMS